MKIDYAFIADSAQVTSDGKIWVLGGEVARIPLSIPLPFIQRSLAIVFKLVWGPSDADDHTLSILLLDPNNVAIMPTFSQPVSRTNAKLGAEEEHNLPLCFTSYGIPINSTGKYSFHISVNGIELARRFFLV